MDREHVAQAIAEYFRDKPAVVAIYLFGSVARGTAGPRSDIDVGILYHAPPASTLLDQPYLDEANLADRLGCPVQVIVMNRAGADLVHRILRDGMLVLEADKSRRVRFEVRSRNEYFDLLPVLRRYREGPSA
jgi:uncharacterized protein